MQDSPKAKLLDSSQVAECTHYSYETIAGDIFTVVRPDMGREIERAVRQELLLVCVVAFPTACAPIPPQLSKRYRIPPKSRHLS